MALTTCGIQEGDGEPGELYRVEDGGVEWGRGGRTLFYEERDEDCKVGGEGGEGVVGF